jgi:hypothetical protein
MHEEAAAVGEFDADLLFSMPPNQAHRLTLEQSGRPFSLVLELVLSHDR